MGGLCPVVSLVPRSTTGYRLGCLRHQIGHAYPGGMKACSRWLSEGWTVQWITHPPGVPASSSRHWACLQRSRIFWRRCRGSWVGGDGDLGGSVALGCPVALREFLGRWEVFQGDHAGDGARSGSAVVFQEGVAIGLPDETDSPLMIDSDGVLTFAVPLEGFEAVARRDGNAFGPVS